MYRVEENFAEWRQDDVKGIWCFFMESILKAADVCSKKVKREGERGGSVWWSEQV